MERMMSMTAIQKLKEARKLIKEATQEMAIDGRIDDKDVSKLLGANSIISQVVYKLVETS